jgi:phenylpropionate dioxygenase-like ring-hydroxylating dioxygenase large terminal subunit
MHHERQIELLASTLALEAEGTTDMADQISTVAIDTYTDPAQFEREENHLFKQLPVIVGHASQLPQPGDYLTRDICGVPVIVLRRDNGDLRAFINVCKHRGGRLLREAQGSGLRSLVCQYHAWTYTTDGSLRGIPHKEGFESLPQSCKQLTELPLVERYGLLWLRLTPEVNGDATAAMTAQLDAFLPSELCEDLEAYKLASHVVFDPVEFHRPINWKLAIDTFLENYHVRKTHRATIDAMFIDNLGLYQPLGDHLRNLYAKKSIVQLRDLPQDEWRLNEHGNILYCLFPNTLLLMEPDHVNVSIVYPEGMNGTHLINFTLLPEEPNEKGVAYFRRNNDILYAALEEDFAMATDVQNGLRSGATDTLIHGRFEKGLSHFHRMVAQHSQNGGNQ